MFIYSFRTDLKSSFTISWSVIMSISIMSFRSPMWIHSWVKVHSAPLCRDCEERTHVQALTASVWYLYPEQPRNSGCHGKSRTELIHCSEMHSYAHTRTHYILHGYTYTLNYPDTHHTTHTPAGRVVSSGRSSAVQGWRPECSVASSSGEDDSTRILTETVDQILQLPAHLKDRDDLEIKTKYNQINNVKLP